jgi:hypothetical protein
LKNPDYIFVTPERKNIRISVGKVAKKDMFAQLSWLIELIKVTGGCYPKYIFDVTTWSKCI